MREAIRRTRMLRTRRCAAFIPAHCIGRGGREHGGTCEVVGWRLEYARKHTGIDGGVRMPYEDELAAVDLFSRLNKSDVTRIAKAVVPRTYSEGDVIVKEGDQAVAFYIITKGKGEGRKGGKPVNTLAAGESFGEMALLDGYPRSTSVIALEDTDCLAMTRWDFTAGAH